MDTPALKAFLAVAETGSFSRGAERVFISQPAISKRIALLEASLETSLFDRIGRTIQLTEAGQTLKARAHDILLEIDDTERSIRNISNTIGGQLRMGASHHIGLHRLPAHLKHFHTQYPQVTLEIQFMDSEGACRAVERGDIELAVATLPESQSGVLELIRIWQDRLDIVVGKQHALAGSRETSPMILLNTPAILPGPGTFTREIILRALSSIREGIDVGMSTNYLEVLKMLTAIGLGWSALPQTLIDESLSVVHINNIDIYRDLGIIVHRGRTLSNAAKAMIEIIKQAS